MELVDVLRFLNVLSAGLEAGGQLSVLLVVVPVKRHWPTELSVRVHQPMLHTLPDRYLRPLGFVTGISALLILGLAAIGETELETASIVLTLLGLPAAIGVAVLSEAFNKPTNRIILTWSSEDIPADYARIRDRWDRIHVMRTASGLIAFVCFAAAALIG